MSARPRPRSPEAAEEFRKIVPTRAVLTELCRGFLLAHDSDRERAARFAQGFLREQTAEPVARPAFGVRPVPTPLRRGGRAALWEGSATPAVEL